MKNVSRIESAVENSTILGMFSTLRRWARHSIASRLLSDERVLQGVLGVVLLVSIVSVLGSSMAAATKFLSFALLFVLIAALTWWLTDPASH